MYVKKLIVTLNLAITYYCGRRQENKVQPFQQNAGKVGKKPYNDKEVEISLNILLVIILSNTKTSSKF